MKGPHWLYGDAHALREDVLGFYRRCEREAGLVQTHVWRIPVCIVSDPALIHEVLVRQQDCFVKSVGLRATQRAFGRGLLTSDKELWRRQRRIVQPLFHTRRVEGYRPQVEASLAKRVASIGEGGVRDVHADMTELCFEVLAHGLFGESMEEGRPLIAAAAEALHEFHRHYARSISTFAGGVTFWALRTAVIAAGRPDFVFDPSRLPLPHARRFRDVLDALDGYADRLISRRRREPLGDDLLSVLLSATDEQGEPLSAQQIRDEVVTMFFAGHETGASALTWALYALAKHPEAADRVAEEAGQAKASGFVEKVMRESLRLYPPAYRISRTTVKRCRLGDAEVSPGTEVVIAQWAVQRSERYYDAPDAFLPERWTEAFTEQLPRFAYFPFGGGPRTCIGAAFALVESHQILERLCALYTFRPVDAAEPKPQLGVTMLPPGGTLRLELRRREQPGKVSERPARPTGAGCPFHAPPPAESVLPGVAPARAFSEQVAAPRRTPKR